MSPVDYASRHAILMLHLLQMLKPLKELQQILLWTFLSSYSRIFNIQTNPSYLFEKERRKMQRQLQTLQAITLREMQKFSCSIWDNLTITGTWVLLQWRMKDAVSPHGIGWCATPAVLPPWAPPTLLPPWWYWPCSLKSIHSLASSPSNVSSS